MTKIPINFEEIKAKLFRTKTGEERIPVDNKIQRFEKNNVKQLYTIFWNNHTSRKGITIEGGSTKISFIEYHATINILRNLGLQTPTELIPAHKIGDELIKTYPHLKANLFRPTGGYTHHYYVVLHLERYCGRIEYFKHGLVFIDEPFYQKYSKEIPLTEKSILDEFIS